NSMLVRQTSFSGSPKLSLSQWQYGGYGSESWQVEPFLILQSSLRFDRNDFIRQTLPEPRFVLNWIPRRNLTKVSGGWGIYYQPVYLSLVSQASDQLRTDAFMVNFPAPVITTFSIAPLLRQPYFETASAEWQEQWNLRTTSSINE